MKLVISGAGGFLGKTLLSLLETRSDVSSVIALDLGIDSINDFKSNPKFILCKNSDFLAQKHKLEGYILINLAFARSQDFALVKSSCDWTFALLEKLVKSECKHIINISSQSVYDPRRTNPAQESDLPVLSELYDMGKYYIEKWIEDYSLKYKSKFINLRIASLVGPGFSQRITSRLIAKALEDGEISVNLNGQIFSYTHVLDMAEAIIAACEIPERHWNATYNVGSDETYTIEDIAENIDKILTQHGMNISIGRVLSEDNGINSSLNSSVFKQITNWQAKYLLANIISEEIENQIKR